MKKNNRQEFSLMYNYLKKIIDVKIKNKEQIDPWELRVDLERWLNSEKDYNLFQIIINNKDYNFNSKKLALFEIFHTEKTEIIKEILDNFFYKHSISTLLISKGIKYGI